MSRRLTTSEVIPQFMKIHRGKYIYSEVEYINTFTKVNIICKVHGVFKQTPGAHKAGQGCPKCRADKISKSKIIKPNNLIKSFKKVHGDTYDYSLVSIIDKNNKVIVVCKSHGPFSISQSAHKAGTGCRKCYLENSKKVFNANTNDKIINKLKILYPIYDYSDTKYIKHGDDISVICPIHGKFHINAGRHLNGQGCKKCSIKNKPAMFSTSNIKEQFIKEHGNLYNYDNFKYVGGSQKIELICDIHGPFTVSVNAHKLGGGCQKCSNALKSGSRPKTKSSGILYYLKIKNTNIYKIGYTKNNLKIRYGKDLNKMDIVWVIPFSDVRNAWDVEQNILKMFKKYRYIGGKILNRTGIREMFYLDVFNV